MLSQKDGFSQSLEGHRQQKYRLWEAQEIWGISACCAGLHEPHTGSLMGCGVFLLCGQGCTSHSLAPCCSVAGLQAVCWYICKVGTEFLTLTLLLDKEQWGFRDLCVG